MSHKQQFSDCYVIFYYGQNQEIYGFLKLVIVTQSLKDFLINQRLIVKVNDRVGDVSVANALNVVNIFFCREDKIKRLRQNIPFALACHFEWMCLFFLFTWFQIIIFKHIIGQSSLVLSENVNLLS